MLKEYVHCIIFDKKNQIWGKINILEDNTWNYKQWLTLVAEF